MLGQARLSFNLTSIHLFRSRLSFKPDGCTGNWTGKAEFKPVQNPDKFMNHPPGPQCLIFKKLGKHTHLNQSAVPCACFVASPISQNLLDSVAIFPDRWIIITLPGGCLLRIIDSRNRQVVTSIAIPEAGTACSEDIVALACRGRNGKEVRETYLSTP